MIFASSIEIPGKRVVEHNNSLDLGEIFKVWVLTDAKLSWIRSIRFPQDRSMTYQFCSLNARSERWIMIQKKGWWRKETEKSAIWRKTAMKYLVWNTLKLRWPENVSWLAIFCSFGNCLMVLNKVDSSHRCVSEHFRDSKMVVFVFPS